VKDETQEKDLDQLQEAMVQLTECSLFETEESIFMALSNQASEQDSDS
jgi:hypothetical protein